MVHDDVYSDSGEDVAVAVEESSETVVVYTPADDAEYETEYVSEYQTDYTVETAEVAPYEELAVEEVAAEEVAPSGELTVEEVEPAAIESPPLSAIPLPHRSDRLEPAYDPRPLRRSSGAEQMAYDPVDESVNLAELVEEHVDDPEQLRTYLRASQDTLFSGGTVADDLARRGVESDAAEEYDAYDESRETDRAIATATQPRNVGSTLWNSVLAVLQSLMAVVFGAGLFIGFDQLWRWNNLVALILSVLVVLTLAATVRIVRKTEDIVSTLTAVAVGLLVTLGPLALQST